VSASVAFEREPAEPDVMRRPPRRPTDSLLPFVLLGRIVAAGGISAMAALLLLLSSVTGPHDAAGLDHGRWLAFTALVCGQVVRAYANRSLHQPLHRIGTNGFLLAAVAVVVIIQIAIPGIAPLAEAFRATPLSGSDWLLVAVVALVPALVGEVVRTVRPTTWVA